MFYRNLFTVPALLLSVFLSGCSLFSRPAAPPLLPEQLRQQQLAALENFSLQASLAVKTPDGSISGQLRWQQQSKVYQTSLRNFLGVMLFELEQTPYQSKLTVRGESYQAVDASSLLQQLTGWSIPLTDMPLWLKGLPGNHSTDIRRDQHGRVIAHTLLDSNGTRWQLEYQSFFNDALSLPKTLQLQSDDTRIQLVIRSWQQ